jgi:hypothetical protein
MNQVRRIAQQDPALVKCLPDEAEIPLGEVANAAVDQLGAPARGSVSEVEGFEQERSIAARCGVNR